MADGKKVFSLYTDLIELVNGSNVHGVEIEPMTDEEAGMLFRWILEYVNDKHPAVPKQVKYAVVQVKKLLDNDLVKWKEKCKINRANGALGGRPKKPKKTEKTQTVITETQKNPEKPDKDKDKDIYIDKSINDKSCAYAREENLNLNPKTKSEISKIKEILDYKNLDIAEFQLMHVLVRQFYVNQQLGIEDCIALSELLKEMDSKYDKSLVVRAWIYSVTKAKKSKNPAAYITSILEKNILNIIRNEESEKKTIEFNELLKN